MEKREGSSVDRSDDGGNGQALQKNDENDYEKDEVVHGNVRR